tara:strand:- start:4777 stop:5397 length:621 start_codon:yes stop_codon:yes gene_type:complete
MDGNLKIVNRDIDDLIPAEYNPRQLSKDQYRQLRDSIKRFGLVDPIIVNINKDREDIIIGGHQRVKVARSVGLDEVPCVEIDLTYEKERELNIRLNKNTGEFDYDVLANMFDIDELIDWGFSETDFNKILSIDPDEDEPELEISPELFERHDYVLFYFDNEFDWNVISELFDLNAVYDPNKSKKMRTKGLGRVIKGKKLLELLDDE